MVWLQKKPTVLVPASKDSTCPSFESSSKFQTSTPSLPIRHLSVVFLCLLKSLQATLPVYVIDKTRSKTNGIVGGSVKSFAARFAPTVTSFQVAGSDGSKCLGSRLHCPSLKHLSGGSVPRTGWKQLQCRKPTSAPIGGCRKSGTSLPMPAEAVNAACTRDFVPSSCPPTKPPVESVGTTARETNSGTASQVSPFGSARSRSSASKFESVRILTDGSRGHLSQTPPTLSPSRSSSCFPHRPQSPIS